MRLSIPLLSVFTLAIASIPSPEPIHVTELPLPPVSPNNTAGFCSSDINPHRTGCIGKTSSIQSGNFLDDNHVTVAVSFTGAPASPAPACIYNGLHLIIVRTNGTTFDNGDPWKCITCGIPDENKRGIATIEDYPQAFGDGKRILSGKNIVEYSSLLASSGCTPDRAYIYPILWNTKADGSGAWGSIRELRLHPDNAHLGFNSFAVSGGSTDQFGVCRRQQLYINHSAITVGEFRGFSARGKEAAYVGNSWESSNIDLFAADLTTGKVRRLTSHPGYADPIDVSPDGKRMVIMDTRGTNRSMFMAGMRHVPPITDLVTSTVTASVRNNGPRCFFQPWLLDYAGDRGSYYGQKINAEGDGSPGSVNDPEWNGMADPRWSPDGTRIVYYQALTVPPSCGGANPLPCPKSTASGGRTYRLMLAHLTSRTPLKPEPVGPVSDVVPWGLLYEPGSQEPSRSYFPLGDYILKGRASGSANVTLSGTDSVIHSVAVSYGNFSDDGLIILNGRENVTVAQLSITLQQVDWYSDLVSVGESYSTKKTSSNGFHLRIDMMTNIFNANGSLTTNVDGVAYRQPMNHT